MAAMAIQMHRAHVCAAANRGLLQHRLERRQHATHHLGDVLHQRLAELLQQGGVADGALTHLQRVRFHHQKHTVRLDRAGGMDRFARATRQGSVVRGLSRRHQGRDSSFVKGRNDPAVYPVTMDGEAKERIRLPPCACGVSSI